MDDELGDDALVIIVMRANAIFFAPMRFLFWARPLLVFVWGENDVGF